MNGEEGSDGSDQSGEEDADKVGDKAKEKGKTTVMHFSRKGKGNDCGATSTANQMRQKRAGRARKLVGYGD